MGLIRWLKSIIVPDASPRPTKRSREEDEEEEEIEELVALEII